MERETARAKKEIERAADAAITVIATAAKRVPWNKGLTGFIPWNKGLKGAQVGWNKGKKMPQIAGMKSPWWKGGKITLLCKECGKEFSVTPARKEIASFCSRACKNINKEYRKRIGEAHSGEKNNFFGKKTLTWKGGNTKKYKAFLAKKRDNHTCQMCGLKDMDILVVDHIRPILLRPDLIFELDNLMTLCPNCHARKTKIDMKAIAIFRKEKNGQ